MRPFKIFTFLLSACLISTALAEELSTTAITIYNENLALVRQIRMLSLEQGVQDFSYDGVAAKIDPTSVHFKAPGVTVIEQNYEYDLVDKNVLLKKYLGETIEISVKDNFISGKLLSSDDGLIIEDKSGQVQQIQASSIERIQFPSLPAGLVLKPTLRWMLHSEKQEEVKAELSYLTRGISWEASYVAVASPDDKSLDFAGWVQIDNQSGATYEDAVLKLMAGDVRIEQPPKRGRGYEADMAVAFSKAELAGFEEKEFFEYHLYTLPRLTTIRDRQSKQISLFEQATTAVNKVYTYDNWKDATKVNITLEFRNDKKNKLGIPLPKGKVRVYKADTDGSLEFIGEDRIDHTPKDELLRLSTGKAFDIVVERRNPDRKNISSGVHDEKIEIEIRNKKKEAVEVVIVEHMPRKWEILEESLKGEKTAASRYEWKMTIPSDGMSTLTFWVRLWDY